MIQKYSGYLLFQLQSNQFLIFYLKVNRLHRPLIDIIIISMKPTIDKAVATMDLHKQSFLKACQYLAIFLAWFQQRNKSTNFNFYFNIYQKIFHSRRLFRLFKTLFYIPQVKQIILELRREFTFQKLFELLGKIFTGSFYALDNITILSMTMGFVYYKTVRRISHSILFIGIVLSTVSVIIELRESFREESNLKSQLQIYTPIELLNRLSSIDQRRKTITIKVIKAFGDLFPTLARTNLPQIIVRTKINKGTVGFFGMISAFTQIYLKQKQINAK